MSKKNIVCFIFARGNSQGLKNKNLLKFNKISLLGNSILQSRQSKYIKKTYVSTDSTKIANEAKKYKAEIPFIRPKSLAKNNSPEINAWKHAISYMEKNLEKLPDYIVSLPTTSPLRNKSDINRCIAKAIKNNLDIVFSVTPCTRNPYYNLLIKKKGKLKVIYKKKKKIFRRQDTPKCYDLTTTCYVFKPNYIKKTLDFFSGKTGYVIIPKKRAIDIDDLWDYKVANYLSKY